MTRRLYYQDAYLTRFSARMERCLKVDGGFRVYLTETAFYPESGGQPADTGVLNGHPVRDVQEDETGDIYHLLDNEIQADDLTGEIDFARRFHHMQHHTGQHVLSEAFIRLHRLPTVGFHLSSDGGTIDLQTEKLPPEKLLSAVQLANRTVWEDRPVQIRFHDRSEVEQLGLRKPTDREGEIRVIEIEGFDRSACGGTHVRRTGEIGLIFVLKTERMKDKTRLYFTCGQRSLDSFIGEHDLLTALSALTTTGFPELPARVEKLLQANRELEKDCLRLKNELLAGQVPGILDRFRRPDGLCLAGELLDEPGQASRFLCQKLIAVDDPVVAIVGSSQEGVLFAGRSAVVSLDLAQLAAHWRTNFGVKGGGRPDFVQVGGVPPDRMAALLAAGMDWCRDHLTPL